MNKPIPFGKYYLLERINVGGMAEVFRAKQFGVEGFERLVAVKRILPNIAEDKDFIEMFVDEAKIAVQLNHANIAQVFDLGHEEGAYYIALEHIHGRDLRAIFDRNRNQGEPMPVPQACFVTMKVCEGLDYAHNKRDESAREIGLVHRDVSPQNVIVSFDGEIKLIDFGIAKAAGRGSQTQAGILKGKFGYMSPEQVRGLPVDRRSDVFSCGIVLYELLTGERLFVGESDFSTLEKVRNVEILPPSTYNRKIQPELERIVLKALAKDVEDRYQNAIDLHDELQAFVYTSGEFYSRKDLASWMKVQWSKEILAEEAKIASYRDMAPPVQTSVPTSSTMQTPAPRRTGTVSLGRKTNPPPIPGGRAAGSQPPPVAAKAQGLEWDDDELETSIYDDDYTVAEGETLPPGTLPTPAASPIAFAAAAPSAPALSGSALSASAIGGSTLTGAGGGGSTLTGSGGGGSGRGGEGGHLTPNPTEEPDLSSLVATTQGWDAPRTEQGPATQETPSRVADGSNRTKSPLGTNESPVANGSEISNVLRMANLAATAHQPIVTSDFGVSVVPPARRTNLLYGLIALSILIAGGIVAVILVGNANKSDKAESSLAAADESAPEPLVEGLNTEEPALAVTGTTKQTGFDLIVDPPGVKVSLDGRAIGKAPLQIRSLRPGEHFIEIEAPAGFFSKSETVTVTEGDAQRVKIELVAMDVIGTFISEPEGATVRLLANGVSKDIGTSPATFPLDPRKSYEVVFEKDGYTSVAKTVEMSGASALEVRGTLSRARVASGKSRDETAAQTIAGKPEPVPAITSEKPAVVTNPPVEQPKVTSPVEVAGQGTLALSAKPPCKIFVDGRDTGKTTPERALELSAGSHRITLMNNEFGIKESFTVKIKAGEATRAIKDYTDQIAQ